MADEGHGEYLSYKETVDKVYALVNAGKNDSVVAYFKGLGEDKVVITTWINVQCDINNVKHDPVLSAVVGRLAVEYCLEKGHKLPAAMILHNIGSFFMPDWDDNVDPAAIPTILQAAHEQLALRREIPQAGPLMWSMWDLGMAELVAGNAEGAKTAFEEGILVAKTADDMDGEAWCRLFLGKTRIKLLPDEKAEGEKEMLEAAKVIMEVGEGWEKESIGPILDNVGLKLK